MADSDKKKRQRNLAIAGILAFLVIIFYFASMMRIQENLNAAG